MSVSAAYEDRQSEIGRLKIENCGLKAQLGGMGELLAKAEAKLVPTIANK